MLDMGVAASAADMTLATAAVVDSMAVEMVVVAAQAAEKVATAAVVDTLARAVGMAADTALVVAIVVD